MEPQQQAMPTIDGRVTVEGRPIHPSRDGERSKMLLTIRCAGCGLALAYANDEPRGVRLAVTNATARPCCDLWSNSNVVPLRK